MGLDPQTVAQNFMLLIAILFIAGAAFVIGVVVWTSVKIAYFTYRQRRSWRRYVKETHRADGMAYPPQGEGFCERCGEYAKKLYFPPGGADLCPICYDAFWRAEERVTESRDLSTTNV